MYPGEGTEELTTPSTDSPLLSGTGTVVQFTRSLLYSTLIVALPRLSASRILKLSVRPSFVLAGAGSKWWASPSGLLAPSRKAMPLLMPSLLASSSKPIPGAPDHCWKGVLPLDDTT
jgi:hypothetical protein